MKATITFEKRARFFDIGQEPELRITMRFTECKHDEFYAWMDAHQGRLKRVLDIGYSDMVILFSPSA